MDLHETKQKVEGLKLELVSIKNKKSDAVQQQDYLKAADLREKEHQVTETVKSQKNELETYLNSLDPDPSNVEEINSIVRMLKEI
jgi:DNA-binding protein H-NS